jgi:hypothetical protein
MTTTHEVEHESRPSILHSLSGRSELALFALGGAALYLVTILAITLLLGEGLPLLGWIGFAVAATIVLGAGTVLAVFLVRASTAAGAEPPALRATGAPGAHRVLVVADEGCAGAAVCGPIVERAGAERIEVLVVAPTLVSPIHYLDSDVDAERAAAEERAAETVRALRSAGVEAHGEVGSESPLEAIADALVAFAADEIVIATPSAEHTNWLEMGVVERARERYEIPVRHLVVEPVPPARTGLAG